MCRHTICTRRVAKGVAICICDDASGSILMGKERFGRYRGRWNVCAGSVEECDCGCLIQTCLRELREEFKLYLDESTWDRCVRRIFWIASTMVAVLSPPPAMDVRELDRANALALLDPAIPATYQEMEKISWVHADDTNTPMSSLARYIVRRHHHRDEALREERPNRVPRPRPCARALALVPLSSSAGGARARAPANRTIHHDVEAAHVWKRIGEPWHARSQEFPGRAPQDLYRQGYGFETHDRGVPDPYGARKYKQGNFSQARIADFGKGNHEELNRAIG